MRFITTLCVASLLLACSNRPAPTAEDPELVASVRALHLAESLGEVDLFVDYAGAPSYRGLTFGEASPYFDVSIGRSVIDLASAGRRISSLDLNLEQGRFYTAVVLDGETVTFDDAPGSMRLIHASRNLGTVDVWDIASNRRVYEGLEYGTAASGIVAGSRIGIDADGDAMPDMVFEVPMNDAGVIDMVAIDDEEESVTIKSFFSDGSSQESAPEPMEPARIRVLHLSPDAPNVDVLAGGTRVIEDLAFPTGTAFLEVPPAEYRFDVTAAGGEDPVLTVDLALMPATAYTAVAYGPVAELRALALVERGPVANGISLRVAHVAVGVGQVDVLDATSGNLILDDVDFGTASDFIGAPAGTHALGLDLDDDGNPELIFDLPELIEGSSANIFAVTDAAGPFLLIQLGDGTTIRVAPRHVTEPEPEPEKAFVRALHLSPDAPAVNAFVNGEAAVQHLLFKQGTGSLEVDAIETTIDVSAGTLEESILTVSGIELAADADYTVAVFDQLANVQALLLEDDFSEPAAGNIRIRAIHTAVGVGPVNILAGNTVLYENVPFGAAGDALEVPAGAYTIGLDVDHDHHADLLFDLPELWAGAVANVFAVTDAHGTPSLLAQLADGTTVDVPAR